MQQARLALTHIRKRNEVSKNQVIEHIWGRLPIEPDFPWFYRLFLRAQEQKDIVFDPWWGYQEDRKKEKNIMKKF